MDVYHYDYLCLACGATGTLGLDTILGYEKFRFCKACEEKALMVELVMAESQKGR